jgi:hypothetical protein
MLVCLLVYKLEESNSYDVVVCINFALTCRNDDEEKAFSSFLNLSRFPQVLPEFCYLMQVAQ